MINSALRNYDFNYTEGAMKFLTAFSCAVFLWTLWDTSSVGIYAGTVETQTSAQDRCRYLSSRGFFEENKAGAIAGRSTSSKWCPSTFALTRDRTEHNKVAEF
jgi:hypothetical protein